MAGLLHIPSTTEKLALDVYNIGTSPYRSINKNETIKYDIRLNILNAKVVQQ